MSKKILVVDDDQYIRELYEEVLKDEGYTVETANDGEEGLALLEKGGYDLILLDVMMPKKDGLAVLDSLSQHPPVTKNGPILLVTNLGHDPIIEEGIKKGATSYLVKDSMNPDQFLQNVKKFLA